MYLVNLFAFSFALSYNIFADGFSQPEKIKLINHSMNIFDWTYVSEWPFQSLKLIWKCVECSKYLRRMLQYWVVLSLNRKNNQHIHSILLQWIKRKPIMRVQIGEIKAESEYAVYWNGTCLAWVKCPNIQSIRKLFEGFSFSFGFLEFGKSSQFDTTNYTKIITIRFFSSSNLWAKNQDRIVSDFWLNN